MKTEPTINVGILSAEKIEFVLNGNFVSSNGKCYSGSQLAVFENDKILFDGEYTTEVVVEPVLDNASFDLIDVVIGINFHWERKENQRFNGSLKIIVENEALTAINRIKVEDYLTSVISSEMSATASPELLKAHAVISRSWLLCPLQVPRLKSQKQSRMLQVTSYKLLDAKPETRNTEPETRNTEPETLNPKPKTRNTEHGTRNLKHIKWYERDAHTHFDVCADDHCQRYQGITRASTVAVATAIKATRGEMLMYNDKICDARYSKSCGGVSETFENCWAVEHYPYLTPVIDNHPGIQVLALNLTQEENAQQWIRQSPEAFCNTTDKQILSQVLNNYDQETTDFYRWKIEYTQAEISELLARRSGIDFGEIIDLIPVLRGESARLIELKIVGTKQTITVGKELEIRKWLSNSHLYSSAFVVDKSEIINNIPQHFTLIGAGWGHGVGLCQIGAAVMGEKGYKYNEILLHYFKGAQLQKMY